MKKNTVFCAAFILTGILSAGNVIINNVVSISSNKLIAIGDEYFIWNAVII